MFSGTGQMDMNSKLGTCIYELCKDQKYRNIFEVGTWNGQGSTICVMNAIINKENSILYSLEADEIQFKNAVKFWENKQVGNKLNLLHGTLHKIMADTEHIKQHSNGIIPYYREHYFPEKNMLTANQIIDIDNISDIDIIILDGGEYSTKEDFNILLNKNPKVIILDDSNVYKCAGCREQLISDVNWNIYKEDLVDRNGWSIFIHK